MNVEHSAASSADAMLPAPAALRRVSWGAILVGVVIALSLQLLLNLLGLGIGASTVNPSAGEDPGSGLAIGAGIWFGISSLLSLYAGGWAAGRLAGVPNHKDGMLHGFTTWSLTTILTLMLLSSAIGGIIGGSASLLGKVASFSGKGAQAATPMLTSLASQATGVTPDEIRQQAGDLVTDPRFQSFAGDIIRNGQVSPQDRTALVQLVAQKQNISEQQADSEVSGWQQRLEQAKQQASSTATRVASSAASGVSKTALWSFVALLLGAIAATIGGMAGSPTFVLNRARLTRATV